MPKKQNKISLVWFKNNLRVNDNASLKEAIEHSEKVIATYVFDPKDYETTKFGFKKTAQFRAQFLIETLTNLKENLEALNIPLFVYHKPTEQVIADLEASFKFDAIYSQKEWTQEEVDTLYVVKKGLPTDLPIYQSYDQFLFYPDDCPYEISKIPRVFTEFRKKCEKYSKVRPENTDYSKLPKSNLVENSTKIPSLKDLGLEPFKIHPNSAFPFKGGEDEALKRLDNYFFETKQLGVYKKTRNGLVGTDYSSKFSAWLANGSISAKTIYWKIKAFEKKHFKNESTYWLIFELIWRDYFKYVSLKHGNNIFKIGGILEKDYDWSTNKNKITDWINGETKEPFVNANMVEFKKTG
jgi:deoxyribodipyrimidine photo-lyase